MTDIPVIDVKELSHTYLSGTPLEVRSLDKVNMKVFINEIVGIIDSTKAGLDVSKLLHGASNKIPIFRDIDDAIKNLNYVPEYFIYGIAPLASFLSSEEREVFLEEVELF